MYLNQTQEFLKKRIRWKEIKMPSEKKTIYGLLQAGLLQAANN